jgi:adenylate cyclase
MISREKIIIRLNILTRNLIYHLVFWFISLSFYLFLTDNSSLFSSYFRLEKIESPYLVILILSAAISVVFTVFDIIFNDRMLRFSPIRAMVFFRTLFYFIIGFIVIILADHTGESLQFPLKAEELLRILPNYNIALVRFIVFFFISCYLNNILKQMVRIVGKENFKNWLFGLLNKPHEEERIFMFIDMKASTTIAEKLKHKKFSHLVQDVFNDMAIVDNYMGDIYQYLGDGAIISWSLSNGLHKNNFLRSFYAFNRVIKRRSKYYQRKYGLVPKFKAGFHVGKIMVLQVGRIRRDISFNGDTLNTTARIESMCGEYKQSLLISGTLVDIMLDSKGYNLKNIGNIKLKGKRKGIEIFAVKKSIYFIGPF